MKIDMPLQDNQSTEITRRGDGHICLKVKDANGNIAELFLTNEDAKSLTGAMKII